VGWSIDIVTSFWILGKVQGVWLDGCFSMGGLDRLGVFLWGLDG
jgi:hypothetical protein